MVIKWSNFAKDNLKQFTKITKIQNVQDYINKLLKYTNELINNNNLGKHIITLNSYDIRQLIFEKHKILYCIYKNEIRILALIHSSQDYISMLKEMIKYLEK